ncbi:YbaB/EbfC family nucleoid-associated protein [Hamadaea sp. NPDC050747]|uniref:YbaB/EbfC family nucleoid-associated protein n=1 Tax=Hamadaea sp. NPDC050747 TaxID=3155789 RepID=UPI0033FBB62B
MIVPSVEAPANRTAVTGHQPIQVLPTSDTGPMFTEYEQLAEEIRAVQRGMAEIRATFDSDDGLVSATVGGAGELIELWLDPRIFRDPDSVALARKVTDTVHRAAELAHRQGLELAAGYLPAGIEAADLRFDPLLTALDRQTGGGVRR